MPAAFQQHTMVGLGLLGMLNNLQKFGIKKGFGSDEMHSLSEREKC